MKNKIYDILVVGSGLSSLTFIEAFLEKHKKIDVISFNKSKKKYPRPITSTFTKFYLHK